MPGQKSSVMVQVSAPSQDLEEQALPWPRLVVDVSHDSCCLFVQPETVLRIFFKMNKIKVIFNSLHTVLNNARAAVRQAIDSELIFIERNGTNS